MGPASQSVASSPPTGRPGESPGSPETELELKSRKHSPKSNFLKHSCFHTHQHVIPDAHTDERRVSNGGADAVWGEGRGRKGGLSLLCPVSVWKSSWGAATAPQFLRPGAQAKTPVHACHFLLVTVQSYFSISDKRADVCVLVAQLCPTLRPQGLYPGPAPLSVGFSRQDYWSGLPFPSPKRLIKVCKIKMITVLSTVAIKHH